MTSKSCVRYKEASELTGMPVGTLYALVSKKKIPHIRIGRRHVLFAVHQLTEWISQHQVPVATGGRK